MSPETATASALTGVITDPRRIGIEPPEISEPEEPILVSESIVPPPGRDASRPPLEKGPDIASIPELDRLPERLELPVLLALGDDVSTDEIMPAGAEVLPLRSNIEKISEFCFAPIDPTYAERAGAFRGAYGHAVVAGANYGQGSSREHAALAPRYLGLRVVIAESFARIHWQNLCNFGVLPLTFVEPEARRTIEQGDVIELEDPRRIADTNRLEAIDESNERTYALEHDLSPRQVEMVLAGSVLALFEERHTAGSDQPR